MSNANLKVLDRYHKMISINKWPQTVLLNAQHQRSMPDIISGLAKHLLCKTPNENGACGTCHSCKVFDDDNHPDLYRLSSDDDATTIKIDQVRSICARLDNAATLAGAQVVCIWQAHEITTQGANAFLKRLEEPKKNVYFILYSAQPGLLLPTIRSRCIQYKVPTQELVCHTNANGWEKSIALLINEAALDDQHADTSKKLYTLLWQKWPNACCLLLADQLKDFTLKEVVRAMQCILFCVLTARYATNRQGVEAFESLTDALGHGGLYKIPTLKLLEIYDEVLSTQRMLQANITPTSTYLLDSMLMQAADISQ